MLAITRFKCRDWFSSALTWLFLRLLCCLCQESHASEGVFNLLDDNSHMVHWRWMIIADLWLWLFCSLADFRSNAKFKGCAVCFYSITNAFHALEGLKPQVFSMSVTSRHLFLLFWKFCLTCQKQDRLLQNKIQTSLKAVSQELEDFEKVEHRHWLKIESAFCQFLESFIDAEFVSIDCDSWSIKSTRRGSADTTEFHSIYIEKAKRTLRIHERFQKIFTFSFLLVSISFCSDSFESILFDQQESCSNQFFSARKHSFSLWTCEKSACKVCHIICSRKITLNNTVWLKQICINESFENVCVSFESCFDSDLCSCCVCHRKILWNEERSNIVDHIADFGLCLQSRIYAWKENHSFNFSIHIENRCDDKTLCSLIVCDCLACFSKSNLIGNKNNSVFWKNHFFIFCKNIIRKFLTSDRCVCKLRKTIRTIFSNQTVKYEMNLSVAHSVVIDPNRSPVNS